MTLGISGTLSWDEAARAKNDARALFNILDDFQDEKLILENTQKAMINILADSEQENLVSAAMQKALRNVLEDFSEEKTQLESTQGAFLNILEDASEDRGRSRNSQTALLNVLDDFAMEKAHLESTQKGFLNILDDFDVEKERANHANAELLSEIAQRKLVEQELAEHKSRLEEIVSARTAELKSVNESLLTSNRELEGFSYASSHVLRAPLRALDGFSRILLDDYAAQLDDEGRRLLGVVRSSAQDMTELVEGILGFLRLGRDELNFAGVDMSEAVGKALDALRPKTAGRSVRFTIGPLPSAFGDPATLQRVWMQLLDNAIKFTAVRAEAAIEIGALAGANETVYFVRDNGTGFDGRYTNKLFGVFDRLHGSEFSGNGIGLAMVRRIVTRHGGRVWAEGRMNEGAVFCFALPHRENVHGRLEFRRRSPPGGG